MSFTPAGGGADRAFELVRLSLLQVDGLPFADALTVEQMPQAFAAEGVCFGEADGDADACPEDDDGIVYTPAVTLWAMLSQALFTDVQRACVAAVQRVAVYYALLGREVSSTNTGADCRARAKVTEGVVRRLAEGVASRCEAAVPDEWRWHGFRTLFAMLQCGDLILADRYYGGWFMLALLRELGIEFVTRLHQLREIDVQVNVPGFRTESLVVVTSLFDHKVYPRDEIADLYRRRWVIELELRDIKSTLGLDVLRCKTPEMVRQELWTGLLAYNLIRQSMLQSALASARQPHELSFAASLQMLANTWVHAAVPPLVTVSARKRLVALRILNGHSHRVANRPNRVEPRAVKRRPAPLALLTELRHAARARLIAHQNI